MNFCKHTEHTLSVLSALGLSQWPDKDITWCITDLIPRMNEGELRRAVEFGLRKWKEVSGITFREMDSANKAKILVTCRSIDGPSGVLAECELPQQGSRYVRLWLDVGELWSTEIPAQRAILLADVLWHELGHALGLSHAPQGSNNVMAPVYNPAVTQPGPWDVTQIQSRYGKPVSEPPVVPPIPVPGGGSTMGNFFLNLFINAAKAWLAKAIADGTLQKWLEELLKKFNTGQITTVEHLGDAVQQITAQP